MEQHYTVAEVADKLRFSRRWVLRAIETGKLRALKICSSTDGVGCSTWNTATPNRPEKVRQIPGKRRVGVAPECRQNRHVDACRTRRPQPVSKVPPPRKSNPTHPTPNRERTA